MRRLTSIAVELGRRGGKKGGPARARRLSKSERQAIARKGAAATNLLRWGYRAEQGVQQATQARAPRTTGRTR